MADSNPSRGPMRKMPKTFKSFKGPSKPMDSVPTPPMNRMPTKIAPKSKIGPTPPKPSSPQPTMAEREAARRQNESLRKANVTPQEGRVIESANRSEGSGMKKGGSMKKYAAAGIVKKLPTSKQMGNMGMAKGAKVTSKMADKAGRALVKKSADTMGRAMVKKAGGGKCYAKGGSVSARADGVATKGKTKGKMLARGGKTC